MNETASLSRDRIMEIGTQGGCGLIARAIQVLCGGEPCLRYSRKEGRATHAAIRLEGRFMHLGDDDALEPVSQDEFLRACREDFWPERLALRDDELRQVVRLILSDLG